MFDIKVYVAIKAKYGTARDQTRSEEAVLMSTESMKGRERRKLIGWAELLE